MENDFNSPDTTEPNTDEYCTRAVGRKAVLFLVVTAVLNTMGIGILSPVLPFIAQPYISNQNNLALVLGLLIASYAFCQFIAAPGLGMLSDRYGRRPLLLLCLLGSAIGYVLIGIGGALWVLFLGRIIDGLTGGNFSILYAYVGDISKPEERARYFGLLGAAAGVGFMIGPVIGGFASLVSYQAPLYLAAAIIVTDVLWGFFNVPESLPRELHAAQTKLAELYPFKQLLTIFTFPILRWLLLATFCFSLAFAVFGSMTTALVKQSLGWSAATIGLIFFVVGIGDVLMQGVLIGRILPIFGEYKLAIAGLVSELMAYLLVGLIALIPLPLFLWFGIVFFTVGSGLLEPSLGGLLSRAAGPRQQGIVMGGSQSLEALARILGPLWGGLLYVSVGHASPSLSAAVFVGLALLATSLAIPSLQRLQSVPDAPPSRKT
jgi:DHA1 family tetracycline resistance protein-like MFS transporter